MRDDESVVVPLMCSVHGEGYSPRVVSERGDIACVVGLFYDKVLVGNTVSTSKRRYTWAFAIKKQSYRVDLFTSSISRKRKLLVNGRLVYQAVTVRHKNFSHSWMMDGYLIWVRRGQAQMNYDLSINDTAFHDLLREVDFVWEIKPLEDLEVDETSFTRKTLPCLISDFDSIHVE
eukprot:Lankesteria_metandrocarpae@DN4931_c0_g1_i1.p1